jgi:hypothetical protein
MCATNGKKNVPTLSYFQSWMSHRLDPDSAEAQGITSSIVRKYMKIKLGQLALAEVQPLVSRIQEKCSTMIKNCFLRNKCHFHKYRLI